MTQIDIVVDTPWWLMRQIAKRFKCYTKPIFSCLVPFTNKKFMSYLVIEAMASFRFRLNRYEFGIGAFNLAFWIVRTGYETNRS